MRKFVLREDPAYLHYYDPAGVRHIWSTLSYFSVCLAVLLQGLTLFFVVVVWLCLLFVCFSGCPPLGI